MGYELLNVLVFFLFGIAFVVVAVSCVSRLLRPRIKDPAEPAKMETYECGEPTVGSSWVRFDMRFYVVALIFLIFDVEVTFLYPWALIFKPLANSGLGLFVFAEVFLFLLILGAGFVYCWAKRDLDWVKSTTVSAPPGETIPSQEPGSAPAESSAGKAEVAGVAQ